MDISFINRFIDKCEVTIWQSLKFSKNLELLVNDLLNVCQQEVKENLDDKLKQLLKILVEKIWFIPYRIT